MLNSAVATGVRRRDLDTFNQQVMLCQHLAFTLAAYLLGDERAADEVVRQAVVLAFQRRGAGLSVRVAVLRQVLRLCDRTKARGTALPAGLASLPIRERRALLLVDVLRLPYGEAAQALDGSTSDLTRWVASARQRLAALAAA